MGHTGPNIEISQKSRQQSQNEIRNQRPLAFAADRRADRSAARGARTDGGVSQDRADRAARRADDLGAGASDEPAGHRNVLQNLPGVPDK